MALADAEPKAGADPYYGYYGLGYHGLGYLMATTDTTARGLLMLSPLPLLRLIPTTSADTTATMVLDTVPTDRDTPDTDTTVLDTAPTDTVLATTATALVCTDTTD